MRPRCAVTGIILGILYLDMDKSNKVCAWSAPAASFHLQNMHRAQVPAWHASPAGCARPDSATRHSHCMPLPQGIQDRNGLIFFILIGPCIWSDPLMHLS